MGAAERAKEIIGGNAFDVSAEECIVLAQQLQSDDSMGNVVCGLLDCAAENGGALDTRLAGLMAQRYKGAFGSDADELLAKLWLAVEEQDSDKLSDLREELPAAGKHYETVFWAEVNALLGDSIAARTTPLYAINVAHTAIDARLYEIALKPAKTAIFWLEKIESGLQDYDYPWGALPNDVDLAPQLSKAQADSWAVLGRANYMMWIAHNERTFMDAAKDAFGVAFGKGSFTAGFYLAVLTPETNEELSQATEIANSMLDYDMEACLAEIDALPENENGSFACALLNTAANGLCFGIGNLPVSYEKAYAYYELSAQRGDELARQELGRFSKKLFGGLTYK